MALTIKWTQRALANFENIIAYIQEEFGSEATKFFIRKTYSILDVLQNYPSLGTVEVREKGIKGVVITKHNKLFYRHTENNLIILAYFDTRQDPQKKNL